MESFSFRDAILAITSPLIGRTGSREIDIHYEWGPGSGIGTRGSGIGDRGSGLGDRGSEMTNVEFVLSGDQRDEIMKAVKPLNDRVKEMVGKPHWQALYVIGTNLAIIQTNLTNLPRASSN